MCLTKHLLDGHFDLEKLQQKHIVLAVMALHDANRGEQVTKKILKRRACKWGWRALLLLHCLTLMLF